MDRSPAAVLNRISNIQYPILNIKNGYWIFNIGYSYVPLQLLEIVAHGKVVGMVTSYEPGQTTEQLSVELDLPVERGIWIAARAWAGPQQAAHTTPVYVTVNEGGFYNSDMALRNLDLSEGHLAELEQEIAQPNQSLNQHAWRFREGLEERIAETRAVIARLREDFAGRN